MSITPGNPNAGGGGGASVNPSIFGHIGSLPNVKPVPCRGSNLATGNTDLYTCPTGKRAFVGASRVNNASGGTVSVYPAIKVSGSYYQIGTTSSVSTGTAVDLIVGFGIGIVLEAGESLAVNCATTAGANVNAMVYEFDSTANFKTAKILALSNGANTLYTCPTGKNAAFGNGHLTSAAGAGSSAVWQNLVICNGTAGSINYTLNSVPSGGSAGSGNAMVPSTSIGAGTATGISAGTAMAAGDTLVVTTSAGTAGQAAWVNVWEI